MRATKIKLSLLYRKQEIVGLLSNKVSSLDLRLRLWQCGILTDEERSSLGETCDRDGTMGQARELVDIVLGRKNKLKDFLAELETLCAEAYTVIVDSANVLERIASHIVDTYKARNCHLVQVLPGEKLQLDLHRTMYVMPLVIEVKKIVRSERQGDWLPNSELRHHYCGVDNEFESVEDVLDVMSENGESTVLCLGIAGVGKTICVKNILTKWVDMGLEVDYKIVIVIPVRDVCINSPIVDIIGEGEGNLGIIHNSMKSIMSFFLEEEYIASKILIIIDGIDERDIPASCELYQFITGQIYPHVKKLITGRPEAALLSQLEHFYPDYKITVQGTSRVGVYGYLWAVMTTDDNSHPSDDDIFSLIERCEKEMIEFNLLQIPLYLSLVGFVFNFHLAQHCTFSNFIIPRTATNLFNAFITIIIRIWLKKVGRIQEFKDEVITFQTNPVGRESKIPNDIKRVLIFGFGKLSYDFIEKQKYNFTQSDLDEYLIDVEDIKQSGMFCMAEEQGQLQCFYKHKTLQEYMAAVYLSHVQFESESFSKYTIPERVSSKKFLLNIFSKLNIVLKFIFGIEAKFAIKIIEKLNDHLSVSENTDEMFGLGINLKYEASIFNEIDDPSLSQAMLDVLTETRPVPIEENIEDGLSFTCPPSVVHALCQAFSMTQTHTLLKNWFGLTVYQEGEEWGLSDTWSPHTESVAIELNHLLYALLLKYKYYNVQKLLIKTKQDMPDIDLFQFHRIFPRLMYLKLLKGGGQLVGYKCTNCDSLSSGIRKDTIHITSLPHVDVNYLCFPLSVPFCQTLMQLSGLQSLRISGKLQNLGRALATGHLSWGKLTELELYVMDKTEEDFIDIAQTSISHLKYNMPQLKALTLGSYAKRQICITTLLNDLSIDPLSALTTLRLFYVLDREGVLALCDRLPPTVHTLGLGRNELKRIIKPFMQKMCHRCPWVKTIHVGFIGFCMDEAMLYDRSKAVSVMLN